MLDIVHGRPVYPVYHLSRPLRCHRRACGCPVLRGPARLGHLFGIATIVPSLAMIREFYGRNIPYLGIAAGVFDIIWTYPETIGPILVLVSQLLFAAWFFAVGLKLYRWSQVSGPDSDTYRFDSGNGLPIFRMKYHGTIRHTRNISRRMDVEKPFKDSWSLSHHFLRSMRQDDISLVLISDQVSCRVRGVPGYSVSLSALCLVRCLIKSRRVSACLNEGSGICSTRRRDPDSSSFLRAVYCFNFSGARLRAGREQKVL
jgi:hypothetical protein